MPWNGLAVEREAAIGERLRFGAGGDLDVPAGCSLGDAVKVEKALRLEAVPMSSPRGAVGSLAEQPAIGQAPK